MIPEGLIAEAVHDTALRRLQHAYADVVNRRAWAELDQLFLPDAAVVIDRRAGAPLRLVGAPALGAFIGSSIAQFEFFEFVILNAHIGFPDGPLAGTAACRLFMSELRQHGDSGRWTTVFGLYHDRYPPPRRPVVVRRAPVPLAGPPGPRPRRVPPPRGIPESTCRRGGRSPPRAAIVTHRAGAWEHHGHAAVAGPARERRET